MYKRKIVLLLFGAIGCLGVKSQVVLSTSALNAGGSFQRFDDFSLTSSIGEMACINTSFIADYIFSGGVLQPPIRRSFYDSSLSAVDFMRLYPTLLNGNSVFLESRSNSSLNGNIAVYNISGQLIHRLSVNIPSGAAKTGISIPFTNPGEYLIEVLLTGGQSPLPYRSVFKVLKY